MTGHVAAAANTNANTNTNTNTLRRLSLLLFLILSFFNPAICSTAATAPGAANATTSAASAAAMPKQQQQHQHEGKAKANKAAPMAPALIVFGDSIVDPGNNNDINTIIKADFPPYGHDFLDHHPTGRFCNGRIPTDFIASRLGIKDLLPAYLSPQLEKQDLLTGVSFASGGTGFDPLTPQLASVISMPDQLRMFHEYLDKVRAASGDDAKASEILSRGIFAICAGSDDVANTYFTLRARSNYDHASYARLLVQHASSFVEDLIHAGARRVAFIGIPPIGCVPSQRTMSGGLERECSQGHNEIAVAYNAGMEKELAALRGKYPGTLLVFMDIYGFLYDMMMHPSSYGFTQSTRGCCGTGLLEVSVLCNGVTSAVCADVGDYLFWDSYHPTEKAYKILADFVFDNYVKLIL
ncbi:GDSL esterase/lipase EXL3-like [Phragmites australis]|uniref:GDSL esterase/lipase EXL3-like n=1 Tax=Phragmites australis TaxID=29695 RepID=UPI002D794738|nr:GDSL esterase/lipase EXL3-like [Phragmites australis]